MPGPRGIIVSTDKSVNCATLKSIVADLCRGRRTAREKAVVIYDFLVRTVYMPNHSHRPVEMIKGGLGFVNDPIKYITVYGCCGCGPQAHVFGALLGAAGLEARLLDPGFGHVSNEVKWGGKWHWMDVWLPAYITDGDGRICSYAEIMADRDLAARAKQEGRAPGNFIVNYRSHMRAIMTAKRHRPRGRAGYRQKSVEDLRLRPGESVTWLWDHVGKWYWPCGGYPNRRPCGPACKYTNDRACQDAFEHWRPYRKVIPDGPHAPDNVYYRYHGNAIFTCAAPLTKPGLAGLGASLTNIAFAPGGGVRPAREGKYPRTAAVGIVEIAFQLPYVIADTEISGSAKVVDGAVSFCYSVDGGRTWNLAEEFKQSGALGPFSIGKPNTYEYPAGSTSGQYGFILRAIVRGRKANAATTLKALKITNSTMLNFYSRPWLEVGDNKVTVTCRNPAALSKSPVEVTWRWLEDWKRLKSFTHQVRRGGATAHVKVGGAKRPKMKSVTIACPAR